MQPMNRQVGAIAVLIAVGGLCACSDARQLILATPTTPTVTAPPPTATSPMRVQGTVIDFQTAKPLPGAVVGFATDSNPDPIGMPETSVTDANGRYSLTEPPVRGSGRPYYFFVNNQLAGRGYPRSASYRADLAVDKGLCVTRYGMVLDSETYLPVAGASVTSLSNTVLATTDRDGWYQVDWGCGVGFVGFNTTWLIMSHPNYNSTTFASGRGQVAVRREDVILTLR